MSDLIAPIQVKELPSLNEDILTLLFELRQELRILNTLIADGLNSRIDPEELRQDPYYNGSDPTNGPGTDTR